MNQAKDVTEEGIHDERTGPNRTRGTFLLQILLRKDPAVKDFQKTSKYAEDMCDRLFTA